MTKREAELKSELFRTLSGRYPAFIVQQMATAGSPDRVIAAAGRVTMWEFKHGTPEFDSPGLQELMCIRLASAAYCRYVVWQETAVGQYTLIVHPNNIRLRHKDWSLAPEAMCVGYDMDWLVTQIAKAHGVE